jgi:hypothetical protein
MATAAGVFEAGRERARAPHEPERTSPEARAVRPALAPATVLRRFTRSKERPRGVVWFGAGSFWGHLRHLVASAIASESIDSRDWMTPDQPRALLARISGVLGGDAGAPSLVEALGRDLYVDFVADTGDDVAVSRAVAGLVFGVYDLPDPDRPGAVLRAPRGDVLFFGGDTGYPVATADELMRRVVAPWNQVLAALPDDGRLRVLLGVPGNHDWYDGLDGFRRMFRRRPPGEEVRPTTIPLSPSMLRHHAEWARAFVRGDQVEKVEALVLSGYTPVQDASYFALPLAPGLELLATDRQLTRIDRRQRRFLGAGHDGRPDGATLLVLPDPVYPFGEPSKTGTQMIEDLHIDLADRETFVLTGDIHHYERLERDKLLHVIAGGGGAFLHPARIAKGGWPRTAEWPGAIQSRALLRSVPWKLARGRSGFLPHFVLLALFAPAVTFEAHARAGAVVTLSTLLMLLFAAVYALIGGVLRRPRVVPWALGAGLVTALMPVAGAWVARLTLDRWGPSLSTALLAACTLVIAAFAGTFVFGAYLALLTLLGYENLQAFTALDHPGFKHFLRLRVRADGSGIDGWCIGAPDPLRPGAEAVLVDQFAWRPAHGGAGEAGRKAPL